MVTYSYTMTVGRNCLRNKLSGIVRSEVLKAIVMTTTVYWVRDVMQGRTRITVTARSSQKSVTTHQITISRNIPEDSNLESFPHKRQHVSDEFFKPSGKQLHALKHRHESFSNPKQFK